MEWSDLNRYEVDNAIYRLQGYYNPRPNETTIQTFSRIKKETIERLKIELEHAKLVPFDVFMDKNDIGLKDDS